MTTVSPFLEDGATPPSREFEETPPLAELEAADETEGAFDSTGRAEADVYEAYDALDTETDLPSLDEDELTIRQASATVDGRLAVANVPLLTQHRGKPPALIVRWNAAAPAAPAVDVVVHLHGYSRPWLRLPRDIEPISGLELVGAGGASTGRARPTVALLPRGHYTGELRGGIYKYTFPALLAPGGLDALIRDGLAEFARALGVPIPQAGRLILTAHSGGGAPLMRLLGASDPHEVYVYDGLYQDASALARWAAERIRRDAAGITPSSSLDSYMRTAGGALRVLYTGGTARDSRALARAVNAALRGADASLAPWYRIERTTYPHMDIPRRYGGKLLADSASQLPHAQREQLVDREEGYDIEALGDLQTEDEDAKTWAAEADLELEPLGELIEPEASFEETEEWFERADEAFEVAELLDDEIEHGEVEAGEASPAEAFDTEAETAVQFPSGAALRIVATTVAEGSEHYDPNASGNPLLDTGAAVRSTKLATSFSVAELAQSGGRSFDQARIDPRLVRCLQALRDRVGRPIRVSSGYRPYLYNVEVYRRRNQRPTRSQHSSGRAADISIRGMSGTEIAKAAIDACGPNIGVGIGRTFAHVDVRGRFAVWTYLGDGAESDAAMRDVKAYRRARVGRAHEEAFEELDSYDELESPTPPATPPAPSTPRAQGPWIVVVAGHDYERSGVDFERIARNRIRLLIRRHAAAQARAKAPLARTIATAPRFVLFDVKSGLVRKLEATAPKGDWVWAELARFVPVSAANYSGAGSGHVFDQHQAGTMSITDVYAHVQSIGRTEPGMLAELSFFSHGWVGGPILVDSFDNSGSSTDRDPDDRDARAFKDFRAPTMNDAARTEFAAAFAHDAFAWLFGCAFASGPRQVLHQLLASRRYRATPLGKLKDADHFHFSFTRQQAEDFFKFDSTFFPGRGADGQFPLTFDRDFGQIKQYFAGRIASTYATAIARAAGVRCFGALPGTYADYERGVTLPLMVVPTRVPPYSDDFTRSIRFYTHYMRATLDPEGRNYARFDP